MLDRVVNHHSLPAAKIALFRDLFRGRDDVYPRRFESRKTGKYGYQPGCVNEWVRDGVDKPLATLFVDAARPVPPDKEGADRARSATEAFLYRRLESLPETVGKFRLNAELPIPFDGWGRMAVDLLSADARVAVELDGAQHLADPQAYRRDRRNDLLLQQNGDVALRFLAEDIGKQLDEVLDTILRIVENRKRH